MPLSIAVSSRPPAGSLDSVMFVRSTSITLSLYLYGLTGVFFVGVLAFPTLVSGEKEPFIDGELAIRTDALSVPAKSGLRSKNLILKISGSLIIIGRSCG